MRRELIALVLIGCGAPAPTCPSGTHDDVARASAIENRLASVAQGRALIDAARARVPAICFGASESASVITTDRVVLLASGLEEGEAAARLGHLLVHARDGLPTDEVHARMDPAACEAAVDRAIDLEAHAYVVEVSLQTALDARPTQLVFEFVDAMRAAPPDTRFDIARTYLREHPDGGPGIDGLASAYRALCTAR